MAFTGTYPFINLPGANPTIALAPSTTGDGLAQAQIPFQLGQRAFGSAGTEWVFAQAGGTLAAGDCVIFQGDVESVAQWTVVEVTSTNGKSKLGALVGFVACAAVSGNFVWVCRGGIFPNANLSSTTPSTYAAMHTSAVAGQITTTAVGGTSAAINGVVAEQNAQISGGNPVILNSPVIGAND